MSFLPKIGLLALVLAFGQPSASQAQQTAKYKCMIQMTNYMGEEAYVVVSLINPKGAYEKTLYVLGSNKKWYPDLKEWHKALAKKSPAVSAITGASVGGGDRAVNVLDLDPATIDKGYKIRFESAVEDNKYYVKDLEVPLTTEALAAKNEGTGYIRYVRFSPSAAN
jgi:formylmethanofuran dehydrogenase subunit A